MVDYLNDISIILLLFACGESKDSDNENSKEINSEYQA
jgi:hypothetical protein